MFYPELDNDNVFWAKGFRYFGPYGILLEHAVPEAHRDFNAVTIHYSKFDIDLHKSISPDTASDTLNTR